MHNVAKLSDRELKQILIQDQFTPFVGSSNGQWCHPDF